MRWWPLMLAGLWLGGCAAPPTYTDTTPQDWKARQQQLAGIDTWQLRGRVAVINGSEAWHLNVAWQQRNGDYRIELWGPFGSGRVRLEGDQYGVRLIDAEQQVYYASDPESLLYEHTGVRMPVSGLRYWIRGLTDPQQPSQQPRWNDTDRLASVRQGDWQVEFRRYARLGEQQLPDRLAVERRDLRVKLVVDDWQLQ